MVRTLRSRPIKSIATNVLVTLGVAVLVASTLPIVVSANRLGEGSHVQDQELQLVEDYELSCDATLAAEAGETSYERSSMEVEQRAAPTQQPTLMPSGSPSLSTPCSNPFSNARGSYTSSKAPCVITFHNEDGGDQSVNHLGANRKRYHPHSEETSSSYYHGTSNVCGSENKIGEAKEYVSSWPDECVGDFARCYDLRDPNHRMCQGLKKILQGANDDLRRLKEDSETHFFLPWETKTRVLQTSLVPPGTTHVSVDCTFDKEALLESYQHAIDLQHEIIEEKIAATKKQTLFVVVSVLVAVLIIIYAISQLVVQPIVGAIGDAVGNSRRGEDESGGGSNQLASLVSRNSSRTSNRTSSLVSIVSRHSGLRIDAADGCSDDDIYQEEGGAHLIQDDLGIVDEPEDLESDNTIIVESQQIPLDFDAVPIVPATIIPFEAIPAEVMEDGITYYP